MVFPTDYCSWSKCWRYFRRLLWQGSWRSRLPKQGNRKAKLTIEVEARKQSRLPKQARSKVDYYSRSSRRSRLQEHSMNYESSQYKMKIIMDAVKNFVNTRQKHGESLTDCWKYHIAVYLITETLSLWVMYRVSTSPNSRRNSLFSE